MLSFHGIGKHSEINQIILLGMEIRVLTRKFPLWNQFKNLIGTNGHVFILNGWLLYLKKQFQIWWVVCHIWTSNFKLMIMFVNGKHPKIILLIAIILKHVLIWKVSNLFELCAYPGSDLQSENENKDDVWQTLQAILWEILLKYNNTLMGVKKNKTSVLGSFWRKKKSERSVGLFSLSCNAPRTSRLWIPGQEARRTHTQVL